jgi:hypothetical protein
MYNRYGDGSKTLVLVNGQGSVPNGDSAREV